MRNGQLTRVVAILRTLYAERRTLASLAADFSVTTRTIRRDLNALEDAGVAICESGDSDDSCDVVRRWWVDQL